MLLYTNYRLEVAYSYFDDLVMVDGEEDGQNNGDDGDDPARFWVILSVLVLVHRQRAVVGEARQGYTPRYLGARNTRFQFTGW